MPRPGVKVISPPTVPEIANWPADQVTPLGRVLNSAVLPASARRGSEPTVWGGPWGEGPNGGVTFSLLNRFLSCRERFRLRVVEGLRPVDTFNHRIEFGQMWHLCEEWAAQGQAWEGALETYARGLARRYPTSGAEVQKWYRVVGLTFPLYEEWWASHPDTLARRGLLAEHVFDLPYRLPSGRKVRLRGKWDSVDMVGIGREGCIVLQENKTKGEIDTAAVSRQLRFDLQTMLYLVALTEYARQNPLRDRVRASGAGASVLIRGVRYNVVRRPLSGGKGNIRPHGKRGKTAAESDDDFYARLRDIIAGAVGPEWGVPPGEHYFFCRWDVGVEPADVARFRRECLDPLLESMCDWWSHVMACRAAGVSAFDNPYAVGIDPSANKEVSPQNLHWRHPFGAVNYLDEGGSSELDEYLETGSELGLAPSSRLFEELEPGP